MKYKIGDFIQIEETTRKGIVVDGFIDKEDIYYDIYLPDTKSIQTYSENNLTLAKLYDRIKRIILKEYLDTVAEKQITEYKENHNISELKYTTLLCNTSLKANTRAYNTLNRAGIKSILDLLCLPPKKLYRIRNIGTSVGKEIADFLVNYCLENNIDLIFNRELYYKSSEEIYTNCM